MTVIEETPDRLVLEQSPWPTGWFVGFGALACFAALFACFCSLTVPGSSADAGPAIANDPTRNAARMPTITPKRCFISLLDDYFPRP